MSKPRSIWMASLGLWTALALHGLFVCWHDIYSRRGSYEATVHTAWVFVLEIVLTVIVVYEIAACKKGDIGL